MRPKTVSLPLAVAAVALLITLVLPSRLRSAEAAPLGLLFPAPAGTQWKAAAGYNTATHLGVDPYALDLVRADGQPTAGTAVLAPISGTLGGGGNGDCVWVRTSTVNVLICHVIAEPFGRNTRVTQGQLLGTVAPEGQKGNNGLAHIHLAVNVGGSNGTSLPFDGDYLLDGTPFPATTESNAYANGTPIVTSTNVGVAGAPVAATATPRTSSSRSTPTPTPSQVPVAQHGLIVSGVVQAQGISLVIFGGGTNAELVTGAGCGTTSATFWVTLAGRFVGYIPAAQVPAVNAEWNAAFASGIPAGTAMIVRCR